MLLIYFLGTFILSSCLADFDETLLFCKTPPAKPINGLIKRDRVSFYAGQGYLGTMDYTCLPGFGLIGNKMITCKNGQWTKLGQCIAKKRCPPIDTYPAYTTIVSDNIVWFQNDPQQIVVGSNVTLQCQENYHFVTTTNQSLVVLCQNDGTWTSMSSCQYAQPTCDYSKLYLPPRSRITRMNFQFSESNRQLHQVGSQLEYTCEEGYRLKDGKSALIVECLQSGVWSALPICEFVYHVPTSVRCSYPVLIKNGFMTLYNVTIWEDQTYTGRVVYECNYGFETVLGGDQMVSDCSNGVWSHVSDCQEIPTCPKPDLLEIESQTENSYVHNVSLQYVRDPLAFVYNSYVLRVCLPNFEHDPASPPLKILCQLQTNTWTGTPICRPIVSPLSSTTPESIDELEDTEPLVYPYESTTVENSPTPTTADDDRTTESSTVPLGTTRPITCSAADVPSIANAVVIGAETNRTFDVGAQLEVKCAFDDETPSLKSIVCSTSGKWSTDGLDMTLCASKKETTEEIFYDTLPMPSNTTQPMNASLDLDKNLPTMQLSPSSSSSSTPSMAAAADRQARHTVSYCQEIPHIEHAQLLSDETVKRQFDKQVVYSGSLLFVCHFGFLSDLHQDQPFRLTCQNGVFHPKTTCIEKARCSLPPPIDTARSTLISSHVNVFDTAIDEAIPGSFVLLDCEDKTTDEKTIFNMTCLDHGQWATPPSTCVTPFKRRCQSAITIPNARTQIHAKITSDGYYNDGSRASYRCLENFIHDKESGPLHIQCRNGRWGPRPRCIPNGCLNSLPDTIDRGWKSAESYLMHNEIKYYQLTRYSCHANARLVESSASVIDIECRNGEWQYTTLPACEPKD